MGKPAIRGRVFHFMYAVLLASQLNCLSAATANGPSSSTGRHQVVSVTEQDNTREVVVTKGDLLAVTLPTVPGTGYGWRVVEFDATSLEMVRQSVEPSGQAAPGAVEQHTFLFRARQTGSTSLMLEYVRPWERAKPAAKKYSVIVDVR